MEIKSDKYFGLVKKSAGILVVFLLTTISSFSQVDSLNQRLEKYKAQSQFDSALIILNELLILNEFDSEDSVRAEIYLETGYILCRLHRCEKGQEYFRKAFQLGKNILENKLIAKSTMSLGNYFLFENEFDSSLQYYQLAIEYFNEVDEEKEILSVRSNIAYLYFLQGKIDLAKDEYEKIIQFHLESNDSSKISIEYFNLGLTYQSLNLTEDALEQLLIAHRYTKEEFQNAKINRELGKTYLKLNEYRKSAEHLLIYDSLISDHVNRDYSSELLELAEKFKTAEFERDNALKRAEIERNRQQLAILYVVLGSLVLISIGFYWFFTQRRKYIKAASDKQIQDLLQQQEIKATYALLEGQDKERKRIAIELHDNLGSILTSLNMFSDALQARIDPVEIKKIANRISDTSALANEEIRKISHSLDSGLLNHFGLEAAIKQLIEAVESAKDIVFDLELQMSQDISSENGLEIYRIIQELINNSLKHAECNRIHLEVNQIGNHLSIIFEDNGVGFNPKNMNPGMGIKNIQNRVERLDGEISIESTAGKGSTFIIELPKI